MNPTSLVRRAAAVLIVFAAMSLSAAPKYPPAAKKPVTKQYGSVTFRDDYAWLENASDPAVKKWVAQENALTRSILDAVPARDAIAAGLTKLFKAPRITYAYVQARGGRLFAMKSAPPKEQSTLIVLDNPNDTKSERVVFDPTAADPSGATSTDFYIPSLDGKRVAISLSKNGSEDGDVHIFDVDSGREIGDVVEHVNYPTAGGGVAWNADGSGFWYTRYPKPGERPEEDVHFYQQVWFHKLGTPASADTYAVGKEFPRIAETTLETSDDGRYVLATVLNGDGGEAAHWLRRPDDTWIQLTRFADKIRDAAFGGDGAIYLLSHEEASNGKIIRIQPGDPTLARDTVIDEGKESIDAFAAGRNTIYLATMAGGPSELETFDRSGKPLGRAPIPPISSIYELVRIGTDDVLFRDGSYTAPPRWFRYDNASKKIAEAALPTVFGFAFGDVEVVRELATSKDGTKIPVNIIYRKGTKRDGTNPTILSGYGGYSVNQRPGLSLPSRVWLDAGGILAIANLRGGAEFGQAWHEAGRMLKKQNVFDDFAACAQHLIARGYTRSSKLAIEGGSNGGLLMGAALTQHPDLFRAVVAHAGIYDVPVWLATPNGVFNVEELGSPSNPQQLAAIMAYSPYHHVKAATKYPAVLLLTGDNDGRVDPANSRKFAAALQVATASTNPILLRTTSKAGHGFGTALTEAVASQTDVYAFLWRELAMKK
ncbi:MAG: prolyl oligopeptidase [Thermoanaerobaculia bacterium]|jgi:prolyl oligopeptidase|nr:prolyl oligopeptidase [Thermoanaerobaculia bacterium]